jgi:hypothetical protein
MLDTTKVTGLGTLLVNMPCRDMKLGGELCVTTCRYFCLTFSHLEAKSTLYRMVYVDVKLGPSPEERKNVDCGLWIMD